MAGGRRGQDTSPPTLAWSYESRGGRPAPQRSPRRRLLHDAGPLRLPPRPETEVLEDLRLLDGEPGLVGLAPKRPEPVEAPRAVTQEELRMLGTNPFGVWRRRGDPDHGHPRQELHRVALRDPLGERGVAA